MKKPRIVLLTGGSGGVGSALIARLHRDGWRVRAMVHSRPVPDADEVVEGDLANGDGLTRAADGANTVMHLAALTHSRDPDAYGAVNVGGTAKLTAAARAAGVERFVLVSSRAAGSDGGPYCVSKLQSEDVVRDSGLGYVIVRLPELYGSGGREGTEVIRRLAARGAPIPVVGKGEDLVCPGHVDDAIDALAGALSSASAAERTYTLAGECMSVREYAEACVSASGRSSRVIGIPVRLIEIAAKLGRIRGAPIYPDQVDRLRSSKAPASPNAQRDLGFSFRPLTVGLRDLD